MSINLTTIGDSITVGFGVSDTEEYANRLAAIIGASLDNRAFSGDQAGDQSWKAQSLALPSGAKATIMVGVNDHRIYQANATKREHYRAFLNRLIADVIQPARVKGVSLSKSGTWTNTIVGDGGVNSDTAGSVVSATVSGRFVSIGYIIQNDPITVGSSAIVKIDGNVVGSISCDGATAPMNTYNGRTYASALKYFDAGSTGSHVVQVIQNSAGKRVYIDNIRGDDQANNIQLAVGNVIRMTAAGYAANSGGLSNDANVTAYCGVVSDLVTSYAARGFDISLIDVNAAIDPATDLLADGVHPNVAGHTKLYNLFDAVTGHVTLRFPTTSGTTLVVSMMNGIVTSYSEE